MNDVMGAIELSNELSAGWPVGLPFDQARDRLAEAGRPCVSTVTYPGRCVVLRCFHCGARLDLAWDDRGLAEPRLRAHVDSVCPTTRRADT